MLETPTKTSANSKDSNSPLSWVKLLGVRKSSDALQDAKNQSHFSMLTDMMHQFSESPDDISMVATYAKKLKKMREEETGRKNSVVEHFSSISTVKHLDEDILIQWLLKQSDLTTSDMMLAKRFDPEAPWQLYAHATATGLFTKLPEALQNVEVWKIWSEQRQEHMKNNLKNFKETGGITETGQLVWKDRVMKFAFNKDSILIGITHVATGVAGQLPPGTHITKEHSFKNFWSEVDVVIRLGNFPPLKALMFFPQASTAFGYTLGLNNKECANKMKGEVLVFEKSFSDDLQKVKGAQASSASTRAAIKQELTAIHDSKRQQQMVTARRKALENVAMKGKKRTLDLKVS
eukprot:5868656-Lingulodinium_polyedra.AAC.1